MKVIDRDGLEENKKEYRNKILNGEVFVYPTDTIYGIGCNAFKKESINKIRRLKERPEFPFSVIVPSKDWIRENCIIDKDIEEWIDKLPGDYTLILELKEQVVPETLTENTIGIRLPDHWISEFVNYIDVPIVTTSVNKHGESPMTSIDNIDPEIEEKIDFILYENEIKGSPSTIVDLTKEKPNITERK